MPRFDRMLALTLGLMILSLGIPGILHAQTRPSTRPGQALNPSLPTLWIVGDSTANSGRDLGWGNHIAKYFDTTKINIANRAVAGRSSRTYQTGGTWAQVLPQMKSGDFAIFQMGHNDADPINTDKPGAMAMRARGVLPGIGDESEEIDNGLTHQHETVHTFGWYMRKFLNESKSRGVTPIVASLTVHNKWGDGKIERDYAKFATYAKQLAVSEKVMFVDLNDIAGDAFDAMGQEKSTTFFNPDTVHSNPDGSNLNATFMVAGLKGLTEHPLDQFLSEKGKEIDANTKYLLK